MDKYLESRSYQTDRRAICYIASVVSEEPTILLEGSTATTEKKCGLLDILNVDAS